MRLALGALLLAVSPAVGVGATDSPTSNFGRDNSTATFARSWYIEEFQSEVRVLTTGSVQVTERIRVRFDGSYNGIY